MYFILKKLKEGNKQVKKEAEAFLYYCKTNQFPKFAETYNSHLPVEDFSDHFIENYNNRVKLIDEEL